MASWALSFIVLLGGLGYATPTSRHQVLSTLLKSGFLFPSSEHSADTQLSQLVTQGFLQLGKGLKTNGNVFSVNTTVPRACLKPEQEGLLLCTNVANQAYVINEWLVYHLWVAGVNHIVLYDDNSTDNLHDVLQPWVQAGLVTLHGAYRDHDAMQWKSQQHCVDHYSKKYKWVSNMDIDEWLFPIQQPCIPDALEPYNGTAGLSVGSSMLLGEHLLARRDSISIFEATGYSLGVPYLVTKPVCSVKHAKGFPYNMPHCCMSKSEEGFFTVNEKFDRTPANYTLHPCYVLYNHPPKEPRNVMTLLHFQGISLEERMYRLLTRLMPGGIGFTHRKWPDFSILGMFDEHTRDLQTQAHDEVKPSDSILARMKAFEHVLNSVLIGRAPNSHMH